MATTAPWPLWLATVAAFSVSSCADNDTSLYVAAVLAPQAPACTFTADPSATQLLRGTLDVALNRSYSAVLLVANQLAPRGDKAQLRAETQGVELRGAEVRLTDAKGTVIEEFSTPTGGFVAPNTGETAGYGVTSVTLVPPDRGDRLLESVSRDGARSVIANVRVFGDTLGGIEVTSGEFSFVIRVCAGCLIDFPPDALEAPAVGQPEECIGPAEDVKAEQCVFGQDARVDCRQCASQLAVCLRP